MLPCDLTAHLSASSGTPRTHAHTAPSPPSLSPQWLFPKTFDKLMGTTQRISMGARHPAAMNFVGKLLEVVGSLFSEVRKRAQ